MKEPVRQAVVQERKVEPKPEPTKAPPEPKTTAEPAAAEGASAEDKWKQVVAELTAQSKTMGMRLAFSRLVSVEEGQAKVELPTKGELDWIVEGKGSREKQAAILDAVRRHFGAELTISYEYRNGAAAMPKAAEAVELPLEGDPLYKAAANTFKSKAE